MTNRKYIKPPLAKDCEWHSGPPPEIGCGGLRRRLMPARSTQNDLD